MAVNEVLEESEHILLGNTGLLWVVFDGLSKSAICMATAAEGSGNRESSSCSRLPALASSDLSALHVEPEPGSELVCEAT
jgi:hypothetical protein